LLCGDARDDTAVACLIGDARVDMTFTDPPYDVSIRNIVGKGRIRHQEFAMASGEMSRQEFTAFLRAPMQIIAKVSRDGALAYVCMDWRHLRELQDAADGLFSEFKNLIVWEKTNAGMGSLYRSAHELIAVFKIGSGEHVNNVELGRFGRNRTNVWHYPGISGFKADRLEELSLHPTVKPVALVADAIKDVTRREAIVLDVFGGSGTTLIAAERTGRRARLLEFEPRYVDVIINRFERLTKSDAIHVESGTTFTELAQSRAVDSSE
jgi:DNA modification methylase